MVYSHQRDQLPPRHNRVLKAIADFAWWATGWKLIGKLPNVPKLLVVAAPHRSGWEAALGIMAIYSMELDVRWMAKHTIFRWPIGYIARWLGGIAVDRRAAHGVVGATVAQFKKSDQMLIVIMPEGTRAKAGVPVAEWKRGYYHIGHTANVPLMPLYIDHANRRVVFGGEYSLQTDLDTLKSELQEFYDQEQEASQNLLMSRKT